MVYKRQDTLPIHHVLSDGEHFLNKQVATEETRTRH